MLLIMKIKAQPFDTMQYFYSRVQDPLIRCCIRFDGKIEKSKVMMSIKRLMYAYPVTRCRFDLKKQEWIESSFSTKDYLSIIDADDILNDTIYEGVNYSNNDTRNNIIEKQILSSVRIGIEPPVKFVLIRCHENDIICIIASHLLCDGRGFEQILYSFAEFYSRSNQDEVSDIYVRREFGQITKNISLKSKIKILHSKSLPIPDGVKEELPLMGKSGEAKLLIRQLDSVIFSKIHDYAKSNGASINDVILTAYVKSLHDLLGWNGVSIPCPVDLRRFSNNSNSSVCNLTGNYYCRVKVSTDETFDELLKDISMQMRRQKQDTNCLKDPLLFHLLYHLLPNKILEKIFFKIASVPKLSYTNLGKIDEKKLIFANVPVKEAFIATATKPVPYFQLTVSTFKNVCTLTSCTCAEGKDLDLITSLMDNIYKQFTCLI